MLKTRVIRHKNNMQRRFWSIEVLHPEGRWVRVAGLWRVYRAWDKRRVYESDTWSNVCFPTLREARQYAAADFALNHIR